MARALRDHARVNASVRLFTIAGIPVSVHASWLAIYALIAWTLAAGYFPRVLPELGTVVAWTYGLLAALALFASVLVHELAHAVVAVAHGLRVRGITLLLFGGVAHMEEEPPTARVEALVAAAGPLASFVIAATLWGARTMGLAGAGAAGAIADYLVAVNVAVGAFNLIPGFPLDGGRLLRAFLWRWNGSLARATYLASRAGVACAALLMAWGAIQMLGGALVSGLWMVLIGLFLRSAANAGYSQVALRRALDGMPVSEIMARDVVAVASDTTVAELAERFWAHHHTTFPVMRGTTVAGIASLADLEQVPREQWTLRRVHDVMRPLDEALTARPTDTVFEALERATTNGVGRLAVIDGGRLVGYLSLKDITHALALRGLARPPGAPGSGRDAARPPSLRRVA
jgi:Zn-dependent protease/CBS domain-containing protein